MALAPHATRRRPAIAHGPRVGAPVEVEPFQVVHVPLAPDLAARAGRETVPDVTRLARLRVGPIDRERFDALLHTSALKRPLELARRYLGDGIDVEIELRLAADEAPASCWGRADSGPLLGAETWLRVVADGERAVLIPREVCRRLERGESLPLPLPLPLE